MSLRAGWRKRTKTSKVGVRRVLDLENLERRRLLAMVTIDPVAYEGYYDVAGTGRFDGPDPLTLDLAPGTHVIKVLGLASFSFDVDAGGNVSSQNTDAAVASGSTLTFNNTTVTVDPGAFAGAYDLVGRLSGVNSYVLVPGLDDYRVSVNASSRFSFNLDAAGNVTSQNPAAAVTNGSTLTFNNTTVTVDPGAFAGAYDLVGRLSGVNSYVLVPGLDDYRVNVNASSSFRFNLDAAGNVISQNPDAAVASGSTLTFNNTTIIVDPGAFAGAYDLVGRLSGVNSYVLVPGLDDYRVSVNASSRFSFNLDAAGNVTSQNPDAAVASGSTLTFNNVTISVDPGGYTGTYDLVGRFTGPQDFVLVPNLPDYSLRGASSPFNIQFALDAAGDPSPSSADVTVDGQTFTFQFTAQRNQAPTAEAGGPYLVAEGGAVALDGSASSDPDQTGATLVYQWDLDGDGVFGETGTAAVRGDETGAAPSFSAVGLDGPQNVTVALRVTDDGALGDEDTAVIEVANAAPAIETIFSSSPDCGGAAAHEAVTVTASFSDAGVDDSHSATIDWGDGGSSAATVSGGTVTASRSFSSGGIFTATLTVTDDDGDSASATTSIVVVGAGVNGNVLQVVGTEGADVITVLQPDSQTYQVNGSMLASNQTLPAAGVTRIHLLLCDGDDKATISGSITVPATLDGGAGDDKLKGGGGDDTLLGRDGHDLLVGKAGRDLLIGGLGADRLVGNVGDDILIAGYTSHDDNAAALDAVMVEWTSGSDYATRVAHLSGSSAGGLNGATLLTAATVFDDGDRDVLTGSGGQDWFFANEDGDNDADRDKITDLSADEFAQDLDWILTD